MFDKQKKDCLARIDKSNKKTIDKDIKPLIDLLNSLDDYYTTSSCSGRILLIEKRSDNKKDTRFAFAEHKKANLEAIKKSLAGGWGAALNLRSPRAKRAGLKKCESISQSKFMASSIGGDIALKTNNDVWLKQESIIMHVCCRNLEAATKLLKIVRDLGIKRAGIINVNKRLILEIIGTESMETIIARKGKMLVNDEYLRILVEETNKKLERNKNKIKELYKEIKSNFSPS